MLLGKKKIFIFCLLVFLVSIASAQGKSKVDSLLIELENPHHDTIKFDLLIEIGDLYYFSEPLKAIEYFTEALELSEENLKSPGNHEVRYMRQKAKAIHYIAYVYSNMGVYITALEKQFQVLEIGEEIGCNLLIYNSYNSIAIINHHRKNYDVALEYYTKALEITELMNHDVGSVKMYNNLGVLYRELGNETDSIHKKQEYFEKSLSYFEKALIIRERLNDKWGQALCINNLGKLTKDGAFLKDDKQKVKSELSEALNYFWRAIKITNEINDNLTKSKAYRNIAEIYLASIDIEDIGHANRRLYLDSAVFLAVESYRLADKLNALPEKQKTALLAKNAFTISGDLPKALDYANMYIIASDELFSEEKTKSLDEMRIRYETEKKENEILLLRQENELNVIRIQNVRRERTIYIIILASLFILSLMFYMLYNNRKRTGKLLEEKNRELNSLNTTKDKFISILAHDLRNPFSAFLNITNALNQSYDEIDNAERKSFVNQLNHSAIKLNNLLKNMLEWAAIKHKSDKAELETLNLREVVEEVVQTLSGYAQELGATVENHVPNNLKVCGSKTYITSILNNLITNAVKFNKEEGLVSIYAEPNDMFTKITVEDKGVGISQDDIQKLFRIDTDTHTIGKSQRKGTGMGLILCKELIDKLNGKIWVESELGIGSKFIFTLPLDVKCAES